MIINSTTLNRDLHSKKKHAKTETHGASACQNHVIT